MSDQSQILPPRNQNHLSELFCKRYPRGIVVATLNCILSVHLKNRCIYLTHVTNFSYRSTPVVKHVVEADEIVLGENLQSGGLIGQFCVERGGTAADLFLDVLEESPSMFRIPTASINFYQSVQRRDGSTAIFLYEVVAFQLHKVEQKQRVMFSAKTRLEL